MITLEGTEEKLVSDRKKNFVQAENINAKFSNTKRGLSALTIRTVSFILLRLPF